MRFKKIIGQNNLKSKLTKEVLDKKIRQLRHLPLMQTSERVAASRPSL